MHRVARSSLVLVPAFGLGCFDPAAPAMPPAETLAVTATGTTSDASSGEPPDATSADTGVATMGVDSGTTGDPDDTGTADESAGTTAGAGCGNGIVEAPEECDDGPGNGDDAACTSQCMLAVCGDGLVHAGREECDDAGESAACDSDCTAASCGDGVLNVSAGEECDGGPPIPDGSCDAACLVACNPGFDDCNGMLGDGCEADLSQQGDCIACGLSWQTVTLDGVDDVSISGSLKGPANRVAAYTNFPGGSGSVVGYLGFDTTSISDSATIVGGRLYLHHEVGFGNPYQSPVVQLVQADANNWTWAGTNAGDITPGAVISGTWNMFSIDAYNEYAFDPTAWDITADLVDDWMTLGIDETGMDYHYVYFYGTDDPANTPYVELDLCQ